MARILIQNGQITPISHMLTEMNKVLYEIEGNNERNIKLAISNQKYMTCIDIQTVIHRLQFSQILYMLSIEETFLYLIKNDYGAFTDGILKYYKIWESFSMDKIFSMLNNLVDNRDFDVFQDFRI